MSTTKSSKGKSSPVSETQIIKVHNRVNWAPNLPGLVRDDTVYYDAMEAGGLVSEVGFPMSVPTPIGNLPCFELRPCRKGKFPGHLFGNLELGDAFANFSHQRMELPAEGSSIVVNPDWHRMQSEISKYYRAINAEALFIISMPVPLGLAPYMSVSCPEQTAATQVRELRWKPNLCSSVAVRVGWFAETAWVPRDQVTPNNPGLAIKISNMQTSASTEYVQPYSFDVWSCVTNVKCFDFGSYNNQTVPKSLQFTASAIPEPPPKSEVIYAEFQSDDQAQAGAIGDTGTGTGDLDVPVVQDSPVTSAPTQIKDEAVTTSNPATSGHKVTSKPPAKAVSQRFVQVQKFSFTAKDVGKPVTVSVIPRNRLGKGEDISRVFRKFIFAQGGFGPEGYQTGMEFKIVSAKIPGLAGYVSIKPDGDTRFSHTWHELGGEATTLFVPFKQHISIDYATKEGIKYLNRPQVSTQQAAFQVVVTLESWNGGTTDTTTGMTLFARVGNVQFSVPIKPRKAQAATLDEASAHLVQLGRSTAGISMKDVELLGVAMQYAKPAVRAEEQADDESFVPATETQPGQAGDADLQFHEDGSATDDFLIRLPDFYLPVDGSVVAIPLLPWGLQDQESAGGLNPLQELCERYGAIQPCADGEHGPSWAKVKLQVRLPTNAVADVAAVCIPGDMQQEVATRLFGLDSLLSIGGSILGSIGGPLLTGALDSVANVIGDTVGGAIDTIGGLLGGPSLGRNVQSPSPSGTSEVLPALELPVELPRHMDFLRTLASSAEFHDATATLMAQLQNTFGLPATLADTGVRVRPFLSFKRTQFGRSVFDREISPPETPATLNIQLEFNEVGYILERLAASENPNHHKMATNALSSLVRLGSPDGRRYPHTLFTDDSKPLVGKDEVKRWMRMILLNTHTR